MKNSLIIIIFFALGILASFYRILPDILIKNDFSIYALYVLILLVGIGMGGDKRSLEILKSSKLKIVLVPITVIIGTFVGVAIASIFINVGLRDSLAVGAGFGWYSLSSIFITKISGGTLGVIALLSNIFREIITFAFTPLLIRYFGKLAPIASGGATSMDTTLPIITKFAGKEYAIISMFSGVTLSLLVPFLVTFILTF